MKIGESVKTTLIYHVDDTMSEEFMNIVNLVSEPIYILATKIIYNSNLIW